MINNTQTPKPSFQQRLDRKGGVTLTRTPGSGETVHTIFQGVSLLAGEDYPLWRLEHIIMPVLEKYNLQNITFYEDLVYHAADLAEPSHEVVSSASKQRRKDGYWLLHELLIAPFLYLDAVQMADIMLPDEFNTN